MSMSVYVTHERCAFLIDETFMEDVLKKNGIYDTAVASGDNSPVAVLFDSEYDDPCDGFHRLHGFDGWVDTDGEVFEHLSEDETISTPYINTDDIRFISSDALPMLFKPAYSSIDELIAEYQRKIEESFGVSLDRCDIMKRLVTIVGWRIA